MEFRVLGPIVVCGDSGAIALGGTKPRAVLAMLLLHANQPVSAERLAMALWGEESPQRAVRAVQVHVSRLRKALGDPEILTTTPAGYRLRVRAGELDALVFEEMLEQGCRALADGQPERAATMLRDAMALWRGPPLADLALEPFARAEVARLEELRLSAIATRIDADLQSGRHAELVSELRQLAGQEPAHEQLTGQLMLALYRCGRQAEALDAYRSARRRLLQDEGVEPGPQLRRLHEDILRQDAALDLRPATSMLPAALDTATAPPFAGRDAELGLLRARWAQARDGAGGVIVVAGRPGMGRSRLAAELAREAHREGATVRHCAGQDGIEELHALARLARDAARPTLLVADDLDVSAGADLLAVLDELERTLSGGASLALAIVADDALVTERVASLDALTLQPLGVGAISAIAAAYAPSHRREDIPARRLLERSGGLPSRLHQIVPEWVRAEAARRVGAASERAAAGRVELRAMEAELTGGVLELREADESLVPSDPAAPVVCPFKGLASFDSADAEYFCGRERLVAELVARLVGAPLLGIVGPSGSGKSSVLRAGLLPALANGVLPGSAHWGQIVLRPGEQPLHELRGALASVADAARVVVAVDQFEETFTLCADESQRAAFVDELLRMALNQRDRRVVILAIRADYYGRCASYPGLAGSLAPNHVLARPMSQDELRAAVERPARRAGLEVEPALTDAMIEDVEDEPGALPMLSSALLELWQQRDGRRLTHAAYERAGGVKGAVARLAEEAYSQLDPTQQRDARDVLMRLVAVDEAGCVERRGAPLGELELSGSDAGRHVLGRLADRRLLTIGAGTVEIAHEALLREWPRLRQWIADDHAGLRTQRSLTAAASEWQRLQRDEDQLYRGSRLAEARDWASAHESALTRLERDFLAASDARVRRERAAQRRRGQAAFAGMAVLLVAICVVAAGAISQAHDAKRERDAAASRELGGEAGALLDADPPLSLGLGLEALALSDTERARSAVRQAVYADRETGRWDAHSWARGVVPDADGRRVLTFGQDGRVRLWDVARGRALASAHVTSGYVLDAALSPDGHTVASSAFDGKLTLTDVRSGKGRTLADYGKRFATGLDFSRDGGRLAVGRSDGAIRIIDLRDGDRAVTLRGHTALIASARFNVAGTAIVSAALDHSARIWNLARGSSIVLTHPARVASATFSTDGRRVATAAEDGFVRLWSARTGTRLLSFRAGRGQLASVRFSRDDRRLVTAGDDGVVRIWDAGSGLQLGASLLGHEGAATGAAFVRAGVVSTGEDGTLRRWQDTAAQIERASVTGAAFSPDARLVVSGGNSGPLRLWNTASDTTTSLPGPTQESAARFSPDGRTIVATSADGDVRVWKLADPGHSRVVLRSPTPLYAAAIDSSGRRLVSAGYDQTVYLQPAIGGRTLRLRGHTGYVWDVAFSPDGREVISASEDGTARLWRATDGAPLHVLRSRTGGLNAARFSPDGRRIVTAGADGTVRVWSLAGGPPTVLYGHQGAVMSAAFDSTGERIVSAGADGSVRIWDASGGSTLVVIKQHRGSALSAQFSPDGRSVLSAGADHVVEVSPCEVCGSMASVLALARQRPDRKLSAAERARFVNAGG